MDLINIVLDFLLFYLLAPIFLIGISVFIITLLLILFNVISYEQLNNNKIYIMCNHLLNSVFGIAIFGILILMIIYALIK